VALSITLLAVLALALVALVAWPLVRPRPPAGEEETPEALRRVEEDLERSLAAIEEIDFDHRAGAMSDADYAALDAAERARAVGLMKRRDRLRFKFADIHQREDEDGR
jgi:hypothetical protein